MAFQGKILFIIAVAFFVLKVRCDDSEHTSSGHMFLTRGVNDVDEAPDQMDDSDDEGDISPPSSDTLMPTPPIQETIYEDLHSPEAMQLLTEEYVGLVETEIAAETVKEIMARVKKILTDERAIPNFKQIRGEIYKFMTNKKTPPMIEGYLKNRYNYYVNKKTPALIKQKFNNVKTIIDNENIPKHIEFFKKEMHTFLNQPGDVRKRIANGFALLSTVLNLPHVSFLLS
ncbi:uncharacterized protein LOC135835584 [Planococcus citri]|uniref:uncharacterized protein LOC135835584 n=1 Tax=Planococcus citri TaxID=170843 RepID=UPI0031FA121D